MWHTISRQLTWASECQPIGCAITPLSDISITALPCVTLKQQGAEIRTLSACLSHAEICVGLSVSDSLYIPYTILFLSPYVSMHVWLLMNVFFVFSPHCFSSSKLSSSRFPPSRCFWTSPCLTSACHLIFLPVCLLFVCPFVWNVRMSCTKTLWCVCTSAWTYVIDSISWNGLWCVCVRCCVCHIWRCPTYRGNLSIQSY